MRACAAAGSTDDKTRKPFDVAEVDVVVADAEDICRAAAASALKKFGFLRVHECESGDEALQAVTCLQGNPAAYPGPSSERRRVPIIAFLDHRMSGASSLDCVRKLCSLFQRGVVLPREPFLVCASNKHLLSRSDERFFHCSVLKTFEMSRITYVFDCCVQWWAHGGGEPGRRKPTLDGYYRRTDAVSLGSLGPSLSVSTCPALPLFQSLGVATCPALPTFQAGAGESDTDEDLPLAQPINPAPGSWSTSTQSFNPTVGSGGFQSPSRSGNSVESLGSLLPPKPPFEDVEMKCLVGRGSFGRVYRARWDVATVALKVVEHYEQGTPAMIAFEGALSASLAHPNLVQTFKYSIRHVHPEGESNDLGHTDPRLCGFEVWIVQEWCGLGTLSQKLSRKEMLDAGGFAEVAEVSAEIASAASYLHSRGIIHGDLTSSNVLLVERSVPKGYSAKVTDFGLARVLDKGASAIKTATMGTVTYMPPELFQLEGNALTKKVDVYAFGVILWQLCTSDTPFEGLQPTQVVVMVSQGASLELPAGVPERLSRIFLQSVARNPADRPGFERIVRDLMPMLNLDPPARKRR